MRLTFLGGADEVGASSTLVEIGGRRLLVDAGLRISNKTSRGLTADQLPDLRRVSEVGGIDAVLVTHAHTDHTGVLALVTEQYPTIPVLATQPSLDLIRILQADALRIMSARNEQEGELPRFDSIAVERLLSVCQPVAFWQPVQLGEGVRVTYHPAGHIIGAASLVLESEEGTLVLSGDLSLTPQRTVTAAQPPRLSADALVLESTYGGKLHANRQAEEVRLIETLRQIIERGGKALIPAFALGRAQEVIQILLAYRDRLDAPVYVDGMVRSVCAAYQAFAELLPPATVSAAGEADLFFRQNVQAITSKGQRDEVAHNASACVIVASSGMLTGGPSAYFALELANNPNNAILLTGYQDEESPGRAIQKLIQERQAGQEAPLKIGAKRVTARCTLETYSLSAHADEAELVSLAEAFGAEQVWLVHGEPAARQSLSNRLRERGKRVVLPLSGQSYEIEANARSGRHTAIGRLPVGTERGPVEVRQLWERLSGFSGSVFSTRQLASAWWGDESRADELGAALLAEGIHFAQDSANPFQFQLRRTEQMALVQHRHALVAAYPDLIGQLVVIRDRVGRARLGTVSGIEDTGFRVTQPDRKEWRYRADALVWVFGQWPVDSQSGDQLHDLMKQARVLRDRFVPRSTRLALAAAGQPVLPDQLLPAVLPNGMDPLVARLAVVLALVRDGAVWTADGLLPQQVESEAPVEMNEARKRALSQFPPEARLRKVGIDRTRHELALTFDFPELAASRYAEDIAVVGELTHWQVTVAPGVNQQALSLALTELLPSGAQMTKGPSFHLSQRAVAVTVSGLTDPAALAEAYQTLTGFQLVFDGLKPAESSSTSMGVSTPERAGPAMEINAAYTLVRQVIPSPPLQRVGLKDGALVLTFVSPQVGRRYQAQLATLAQQTGYELTVHPHPDQNAILQVAMRLITSSGWTVRKGPGLNTASGQVLVKLNGRPTPEALADVTVTLEQATGYVLVVDSERG
ncbi:MAG: MBL fold metallo-hydrolase RNA specificity domain-containing protein [Aggregatilineales bacterium]